MRLGVLDVGSNTVHLLVVDAAPGARPLPAYSHKTELRLAEHVDQAGALTQTGVRLLATGVGRALDLAEREGCATVVSFATSAIRDATNCEDVLRAVAATTGVDLAVLTGEQEARLTFLAVRRWFGWSSRRLLVLDIGGGSLELATGESEEPDAALSLPLGAGRLTREWLTSDPPAPEEVTALRQHVRSTIARDTAVIQGYGEPDRVVGTSKTFQQLAQVCGAPPSAAGPYLRRTMTLASLRSWLPELAAMATAERAALPGVSPKRAAQLLAGAIVAQAAMDVLDVQELELCPWALREGVILRHLDTMRSEAFE
jgi:exopolyphosphatase/guanosine-5'-triphosphate,3'-diphosphate pyrophosphatase